MLVSLRGRGDVGVAVCAGVVSLRHCVVRELVTDL